MTVTEIAKKAYSPTQFPLKSLRAVEVQIFAQITARLRKYSNTEFSNFPSLAAALHDNRKLWIILASDIADKKNSLPDELSTQLFALAQFIQTHTTKVLKNDADASIIIDINTAIMRGLAPVGIR